MRLRQATTTTPISLFFFFFFSFLHPVAAADYFDRLFDVESVSVDEAGLRGQNIVYPVNTYSGNPTLKSDPSQIIISPYALDYFFVHVAAESIIPGTTNSLYPVILQRRPLGLPNRQELRAQFRSRGFSPGELSRIPDFIQTDAPFPALLQSEVSLGRPFSQVTHTPEGVATHSVLTLFKYIFGMRIRASRTDSTASKGELPIINNYFQAFYDYESRTDSEESKFRRYGKRILWSELKEVFPEPDRVARLFSIWSDFFDRVEHFELLIGYQSESLSVFSDTWDLTKTHLNSRQSRFDSYPSGEWKGALMDRMRTVRQLFVAFLGEISFGTPEMRNKLLTSNRDHSRALGSRFGFPKNIFFDQIARPEEAEKTSPRFLPEASNQRFLSSWWMTYFFKYLEKNRTKGFQPFTQSIYRVFPGSPPDSFLKMGTTDMRRSKINEECSSRLVPPKSRERKPSLHEQIRHVLAG